MENIRKKSLYALILAVLVLLAAAAFSITLNKSKDAFAEGPGGDLTITLIGDEGIVCLINDSPAEVVFDGGTGTVGANFGDTVRFLPPKYYGLIDFTVEWEHEDSIYINGSLASGSYSDSAPDLTINVEGPTTDITITYSFEATPYEINTASGYISNYILPDINTAIPGVSIGLDKTEVKIGDTVNLSISDQSDANHRFVDYALWNAITGEYDYQNLPENGQIVITSAFLDKYLLATDEINVVAAYVKTYFVEISGDAAVGSDNIQIAVYNRLTDATDIYTSLNDFVDEGCYITITALAVPYFNFAGFTVNGEEKNSAAYTINYLDGDYTVSAQFDKIAYTLDVVGLNSFGGIIPSNCTVTVNGAETTQFYIGDTIKIELSSQTDFNNFTVKKAASQSYDNLTSSNGTFEKTVNAKFLDDYLNLNSKIVRIAANFANKYNLSIALENDSLGGYTVSANGGTPLTPNGNFNYTYDYGTIITIVVQPSKYAAYNYSGVYSGEKQGDRITIVLNSMDRNITLSFKPLTFNLTDKTQNIKGYSISTLNNLKLGDKIDISVGLGDNDEIKSWTINGINVLNNLLSDAKYSKGKLEITITPEWLDRFQNDGGISNQVQTGMKTSLLMLIIIPSVAVPVLAVILIIFFVANARRKKFIKAELTDKVRTDATRNVSGFVTDLREGKDVGQVTDEDVKREMKKKK